MTLRRAAQVAGVVGGLAWVAAAFAPGAVQDVLTWLGAVLLTLALLDAGMLLVTKALLPLRVFVACAFPLLFWMVVAFAVGTGLDPGPVHAVAGALVAVGCAIGLTRPGPQAPPTPPRSRRHAAR